MYTNAQIPTGAVVVTPTDSLKVGFVGLYVGGAGNLTVRGADGASVLFTAVPAGSVLPMQISEVLATGTTATSLVGFKA